MAANAAPRGPRGGLEVQCDSEENREQMEDREADEEGVDGRYEGTFLSCRLSQTFGSGAGSQC